MSPDEYEERANKPTSTGYTQTMYPPAYMVGKVCTCTMTVKKEYPWKGPAEGEAYDLCTNCGLPAWAHAARNCEECLRWYVPPNELPLPDRLFNGCPECSL